MSLTKKKPSLPIKPKKITTSRFVLRPICIKDASKKYLNWLSDKDTKKYIQAAKNTKSINDLRYYLKNFIKKKDCIFLKIETKTGRKHIGNIKCHPILLKQKAAIIGILVGDLSWRGLGVAKEVIHSTSSWLKKNLEIQYLYLGVKKENKRALKAYYNSGFRYAKKFPQGRKTTSTCKIMRLKIIK